MSGLIVSSVVAVYVAGWLAGSAFAARNLASRPRCHGEGDGFVWGQRADCLRYCRRDGSCWRGDEPDMADAAIGSFVGLLWPVAIAPLIVLHFTKRKPTRAANQARIDQLERELGIGR